MCLGLERVWKWIWSLWKKQHFSASQWRANNILAHLNDGLDGRRVGLWKVPWLLAVQQIAVCDVWNEFIPETWFRTHVRIWFTLPSAFMHSRLLLQMQDAPHVSTSEFLFLFQYFTDFVLERLQASKTTTFWRLQNTAFCQNVVPRNSGSRWCWVNCSCVFFYIF